MEPIKTSVVSLDKMNLNKIKNDKNSIVMGDFEGDSSKISIGDIDKLTERVFEILEYLESDSTKKLMKKNEGAVKMVLTNKYIDVPMGIINLLVDDENRGENVDRLVRMFEKLNQIKKGELDAKVAETVFFDEVNERYLYSKFGGKENFEKALANEAKGKK